MEAREKIDEYAEMQGWDKNKLIGWSEVADFAEWLVKNLTIPPVIKSVCPDCGKPKDKHKYRCDKCAQITY